MMAIVAFSFCAIVGSIFLFATSWTCHVLEEENERLKRELKSREERRGMFARIDRQFGGKN